MRALNTQDIHLVEERDRGRERLYICGRESRRETERERERERERKCAREGCIQRKKLGL
jgi:hypothetical protein